MSCKSCAERRRILAEARAKAGIKGVVKAIPSVGRHLVANPQKLDGRLGFRRFGRRSNDATFDPSRENE